MEPWECRGQCPGLFWTLAPDLPLFLFWIPYTHCFSNLSGLPNWDQTLQSQLWCCLTPESHSIHHITPLGLMAQHNAAPGQGEVPHAGRPQLGMWTSSPTLTSFLPTTWKQSLDAIDSIFFRDFRFVHVSMPTRAPACFIQATTILSA